MRQSDSQHVNPASRRVPTPAAVTSSCRRGAGDRAASAAGRGGAATPALATAAAAAAAAAVVAGLGDDGDGDAAQPNDCHDGHDVGRELRRRDTAGRSHPAFPGCAGVQQAVYWLIHCPSTGLRNSSGCAEVRVFVFWSSRRRSLSSSSPTPIAEPCTGVTIRMAKSSPNLKVSGWVGWLMPVAEIGGSDTLVANPIGSPR
jgi:hypothetical protein